MDVYDKLAKLEEEYMGPGPEYDQVKFSNFLTDLVQFVAQFIVKQSMAKVFRRIKKIDIHKTDKEAGELYGIIGQQVEIQAKALLSGMHDKYHPECKDEEEQPKGNC